MHTLTAYDPACGSASFLARCKPEAAQLAHLAARPEEFVLAPPPVVIGDSLLGEGETPPCHALMTNPPFSGQVDPDGSGKVAKLKGAKTELQFVELAMARLAPGGRACLLLPSGFAFGSTGAHKRVRKRLIETYKLEAVFSLPSGTFLPFAGVCTVVVVFSKGRGPTDTVWFHDIKAVGYTLNKKRRPGGPNDLPEAARRFHARSTEAPPDRKGDCFAVPVSEIRSHDYTLNFARYLAEPELEAPTESVEDILRSMMIGQVKINEALDGLAELTGCGFRVKDFTGDEPDPLDQIAASLNLDMRVSDFAAEAGDAL